MPPIVWPSQLNLTSELLGIRSETTVHGPPVVPSGEGAWVAVNPIAPVSRNAGLHGPRLPVMFDVPVPSNVPSGRLASTMGVIVSVDGNTSATAWVPEMSTCSFNVPVWNVSTNVPMPRLDVVLSLTVASLPFSSGATYVTVPAPVGRESGSSDLSPAVRSATTSWDSAELSTR